MLSKVAGILALVMTAWVSVAVAASKPVALSCAAGRVDVLWSDAQGAVLDLAWDNGTWGGADVIPLASTAPGGTVAAVCRTADRLDAFWIAADGTIATSSKALGSSSWSQPKLVSGQGTASPSGSIAAVSRLPGQLDVFWVSPRGAVMSNWQNDGLDEGTWHAPFAVAPDGAAASGSALSAVARMPEQLDLFWIAPNGAVASTWWNAAANGNRWNVPFTLTGGGTASPTGGVSALSRGANHLEVYWIAPDGSVMETWYGGSWNQAFAIASAGSARADGSIAARARRPDHADVFWVGPDGSVRSTWWNQSVDNARWHPPFEVAGAGAIAPGSGLTAVNRGAEDLGVFYLSADGKQVFNPWWMSAVNQAQWNAPAVVWARSRFEPGATTVRLPDAQSNTYRGKDDKIGKSVRPAREGDAPKVGSSQSGASQETVENGFVCTAVPVTEFQSSFESIVLANPTELFYPGAVIDAASIANGSYQLQSPVSAPMRLSINLLGAGASGSSATVVQPVEGKIYRGAVYDGVTELLRHTVNVGNAANASVDVATVESQEELEMFLGGGFSGWGASVSASMGMAKQQKRNVIYVKYVQKDFAVTVDSASEELFGAGAFASHPGWTMVQKVNYGRIAIVRFESNYSADELGASISASYSGLGYGAHAEFNIDTRKVLDETTASAVFIGGDPTLAGEAIGSLLGKSAGEVLDRLREYIVKGALNNKNISVTPISYELVFLDGSRALVQTNTSFVNRECRPLAREVEVTFEGLIAFDDISDSSNRGGTDYNFYTGYQDDRRNPVSLTVYYTDAPHSREAKAIVSSQVIWNANADQTIRVKSSPTESFAPELRGPFETLKLAVPSLTPFGDPRRGGGVFVPTVRVALDPDMVRNDQVLLRVDGQVSREMTFNDDAMYRSPSTPTDHLLSEVFDKHFTLEFKHNDSEHRCFLQFFVKPLY